MWGFANEEKYAAAQKQRAHLKAQLAEVRASRREVAANGALPTDSTEQRQFIEHPPRGNKNNHGTAEQAGCYYG